MKIQYIKSIFILLASSAGVSLLTFSYQLLMARSLSVSDYGLFSSSLIAVNTIAPLCGFGATGVLLSRYGKSGAAAAVWVAPVIRLALLSTGITVTALLVFVWTLHPETENKIIITLLIFHIAGHVGLAFSITKYQLEGKSFGISLNQLTPALARFLIVAVSIIVFTDLVAVSLIALAFSVLGLCLFSKGMMDILKIKNNKITLEGHKELAEPLIERKIGTPEIFKNALPFAVTGFMYLIYYQIDITLISVLIGNFDAGIYSAAFVIIGAIYLIPSVVFQKFILPKAHRWYHLDKLKFVDATRRVFFASVSVGVIFAVISYFLAETVFLFLFNEEYTDAVAVFTILLFAIPFKYGNSALGMCLTVGPHIKYKMKVMVYAAIFNLIFSIILIQKVGISGAAVVTVLTEVFLLISFKFKVSKITYSMISR